MSNIQKIDPENRAVSTTTMNPGTMIFEPGNLERIEHFAEIMSKSRNMVPRHLRGNPTDCMAIIMQAAQWSMDPFAVAQKTYQIQEGAPVAYEAQLINAVIIANGPLVRRPQYEYFGDWDKIQGNIKIQKSQKGRDYAVPGWKPEDEVGVGVNVIVHIKGEENPTVLPVMLKQCFPRNSTNWSNNPKQQIAYAAIRMIARRDFPDVIMGVYSNDEVDDIQPMKDITPEGESVTVESILEKAENVVEPATLEERVKNFLDTIAGAQNMNRLKAIGNQIAASEPEIQEQVRKAYADKLEQFRPKKEQVDLDTGEISQDSDKIPASQLSELVDSCETMESVKEVKVLVDQNLDHRTKDYKDLTERLDIMAGKYL